MNIEDTTYNKTRVIRVEDNNVNLVQSIINGVRYNDCFVVDGEGCYISISCNDERLKSLYIALHNYKITK